MTKDSSKFELDPKLLEGCEFHDNISQVYIRTTEDKLRNILRDFKDAYSTKYSWTAPLGLFISFLVTNLTATFSDKFGCTKACWEALFMFTCIGSLIWFLISAWKAVLKRNETKITHLINRIKNSVQQ